MSFCLVPLCRRTAAAFTVPSGRVQPLSIAIAAGTGSNAHRQLNPHGGEIPIRSKSSMVPT